MTFSDRREKLTCFVGTRGVNVTTTTQPMNENFKTKEIEFLPCFDEINQIVTGHFGLYTA